MYKGSLVTAAAVALAVLGCQDEPTAPRAEILSPCRVGFTARSKAGSILSGLIHCAGNGPETVRYELVDERGHGTELELSPGLAARWGGPRGLNGRKVRVEGHTVAGGRLLRPLDRAGRRAEPVLSRAGSQSRFGPIPMSRSSASSPTLRPSPNDRDVYANGLRAPPIPDSTTTGASCRTIR